MSSSPRKIAGHSCATPTFREEMHHYMGDILKGIDCPPVIVRGVEDHVHILCVLSRTCAPAGAIGSGGHERRNAQAVSLSPQRGEGRGALPFGLNPD